MGIFHYLNVLDGDCMIITHPSGHVSVIDVNNAYKEEDISYRKSKVRTYSISGNFNQKNYPVNPISYLKSLGIDSVFRFILTHPDMDHMGGIKEFFNEFNPINFWDTDNNKEMVFEENSPYNEDDWLFYKNIRDNDSKSSPKRLCIYSGGIGKYYNLSEDNSSGGDGFYILGPTEELINDANEAEDYNDASYVILYRSSGGKILICGDSHDKTWEYILDNYEKDVKNVNLLIAPHHGRKSNRSYNFLDIVNPTLTFFGNASWEHLAYDAWNDRNLPIITNNQANCMIVKSIDNSMNLFVTNETFAKKINSSTYIDETVNAFFCFDINE